MVGKSTKNRRMAQRVKKGEETGERAISLSFFPHLFMIAIICAAHFYLSHSPVSERLEQASSDATGLRYFRYGCNISEHTCIHE